MDIQGANFGLIDRMVHNLGYLLEVLLFLVIAVFAIASITEIAGRNSFLVYLDRQLRTANEELARYTLNKDNQQASLNERLEVNRQTYQELKGRIESLISVGADSDRQTLVSIRQDSEKLWGTIGNKNNAEKHIFLYSALGWLGRLNSDYLLAIAVMLCGAIGSIISSIRTARVLSWRSVLFGLAAGFIVFLAIKGGKHVFLLETQEQVVQFNPYGTSFFGLLAGMFTERSFELMAVISEAIFKKVSKFARE